MKRQGEGGFTLVEVVFGAVVMALMVASIGSLYISNVNTVVLGKARALGLEVAAEQVEALRDLPYDSLATQSGTIYPPGNIADNQTIVRDNFTFSVHIDINYVDDPYDGYFSCPCGSGPAQGKPQDLYPYDYKKAQVTVKLKSSGKVVATESTDIAGKAAETSSNTGILSITVLNANGQGIPNANVTVVNTSVTPNVNISTTTDNNGLVVIPKLPPDSGNHYQITATLAGYSTDGTIPDPVGTQNAVKLNPNVLAQQITSLTLSIDQQSTLYVHVVDTSGNPINNLSVTTTGAKQIKTNPVVYKYSVATATNATGDITLSGMEWDGYSFAVPSGYYIVTASPYAPVALNPNTSTTVNLVVSASSTYPRIATMAPKSAATNSSSVSVVVTGSNLTGTSSLKLQMTGQTDITATGCSSSGGGSTLTCTLNLTSAATGAWNVVVSNSGGTATQTGGFNVTP
ncbi:MAG TPA: carboxypeptidase-like regulatory domain-containing protein [Candidatus Saccharimonadia bacterium]|jgi:type II secretory pathway pseudopilin PulG|nr:carboxypeptidase-like regulatory domain-containing protein [Candidatus Saccharimonadia bacterium]